MTTQERQARRLTITEEHDITFYYVCTDMKVLAICSMFKIDRKTFYKIIHKHYYPFRQPMSGNRSNHPTAFDKALSEAARQM